MLDGNEGAYQNSEEDKERDNPRVLPSIRRATKLITNLVRTVPDLNPGLVISTGATELRNIISQESLPRVLSAYNTAIVQCFYVSVAMAAVSLVGSACVEWKSVKGKKIEMAAA